MSSKEAENVPTSAPMVLIADSRPATFPASPTCSSLSRTAYGETMPSSRSGRAMSTPDSHQRAEEEPARELLERRHRLPQERPADERHDRQQYRRDDHQARQPGHRRVSVGQPTTDRVTDRERHQHRRDGVGPHDRARAEPGGEQPRRGDLGTERGEADTEHDDLEQEPRPLSHAAKPIGDQVTARSEGSNHSRSSSERSERSDETRLRRPTELLSRAPPDGPTSGSGSWQAHAASCR